jgi:hypothetical protein
MVQYDQDDACSPRNISPHYALSRHARLQLALLL